MAVNLDGTFFVTRAFIDDLGAHDQGRRIAELRLALLVLHAPGDRTVDISNAARFDRVLAALRSSALAM